MKGDTMKERASEHTTVKEIPKQGRDRLIPLLQEAQNREGWISREAITSIAKTLGIPAASVYGVATFYNQFRLHPPGKNHIVICRGTACHVRGSKTILEHICSELGIQPGETTRDRIFSLEVVACIGACGLAPVIAVNGEYHAHVTPKSIKKIIAGIRRSEDEQSV